MLAAITLWVAISFYNGAPHPGVFPDQASCEAQVAEANEGMVKDGPGDGDLISKCQPIGLYEPATSL